MIFEVKWFILRLNGLDPTMKHENYDTLLIDSIAMCQEARSNNTLFIFLEQLKQVVFMEAIEDLVRYIATNNKTLVIYLSFFLYFLDIVNKLISMSKNKECNIS